MNKHPHNKDARIFQGVKDVFCNIIWTMYVHTYYRITCTDIKLTKLKQKPVDYELFTASFSDPQLLASGEYAGTSSGDLSYVCVCTTWISLHLNIHSPVVWFVFVLI